MVVETKGLTVKYKDFVAVDNISFDVAPGEIFGIVGPNGAGKTSTMECLEGLKKPYSGRINILGIDPANRKELYNHIGVQLQEASFPDLIKVEELCQLFSSFYKNPADYHMLLERFELTDKKKSYVKKLSGGQKQKISIIAALIANPQVIFLDELTTGLDPQARLDMWELIKSLRSEGRTILMTTHYMEEAEYLCDRVCIMMKGKIVAIGTVKELIEQTGISQKITFSSSNAKKQDLLAIDHVTDVNMRDGIVEIYGTGKNLLRDVTIYLIEHNIAFEDLSSKNPGLEEVFLKLTGFGLEKFS
ncbi:MAG: ABC transporter ATP-binding protein [Clostridiales bacterium]|nr:ABC transporter ATP-binding protein [Clostridiales bacterium]